MDGRRISKAHLRLKALALGRGWWVPRGLNTEWLPNKAWKKYYVRKRRPDRPPVAREDECLIALARSRGIKTPLASALNDAWRVDLALRIVDDMIRERLETREPHRPASAWNKRYASSDPKAPARRRRRQARAKY